MKRQGSVFATVICMVLIVQAVLLVMRQPLLVASKVKKKKLQTMPGRKDDSQQKLIKMEHCDCHRWIETRSNLEVNARDELTNRAIKYNETTCERDAFARGSRQKVVAFSFYGDVSTQLSIKKGYFEGIEGNLNIMPQYYPGHTMRVYYDLDDSDEILQELCQLACHNPILDICNVKELPGTPMQDASRVFAMNWRFFPTLDPQVDVYHCRDLDSRFSQRELAAVAEFIRSDMALHSMRDHPAHFAPMVGASWGTHLNRRGARGKWKKAWDKILQDKNAWADRSDKGPDQIVLKDHVWPLFYHRLVLQHDSYLCQKFRWSKPWPTKRAMEPNNFVASIFKDNATLIQRCPKACRPKDHLDWEYC